MRDCFKLSFSSAPRSRVLARLASLVLIGDLARRLQCTPLGLHYITWSRRAGKWRDKRREKHCQVLPVFFFVNEHNNTNRNPQAKKQRFLKLSKKFPGEQQQLVGENDSDNIRKVLCKSVIQWFWELNLCCYKYRVNCFGSLRLFLCCCWSESLEI